MPKVRCLVLWLCSNRWPNKVSLSRNVAMCSCQMFSACALSLPFEQSPAVRAQCERDASPLQWNSWAFLLGTGSPGNRPVVKAALCVLEGKEQLMFWCGSWFMKASFFVYAQVLLGHSLNSDSSCPGSSRIWYKICGKLFVLDIHGVHLKNSLVRALWLDKLEHLYLVRKSSSEAALINIDAAPAHCFLICKN